MTAPCLALSFGKGFVAEAAGSAVAQPLEAGAEQELWTLAEASLVERQEPEHTCSMGEGRTEGHCKEKGHAVLVVARPFLARLGATGAMKRTDSQAMTESLLMAAKSHGEGERNL